MRYFSAVHWNPSYAMFLGGTNAVYFSPKLRGKVVPALGAGRTSRDLLISYIMERPRKGAKVKHSKDPTESSFGAFYSSDTNSHRDEHNRKGQGHNRGSESSFSRNLTGGNRWL